MAHIRINLRHVQRSRKIIETIYHASKPGVNIFVPPFTVQCTFYFQERKRGRSWCLQSKTGQICVGAGRRDAIIKMASEESSVQAGM